MNEDLTERIDSYAAMRDGELKDSWMNAAYRDAVRYAIHAD